MGLRFRGFGFAGSRVLVPICFRLILHDQRNAAIRRVEWRVGFTEALIGKASNLRHLIGTNAVLLHQTPG